jgi:hypothetical protein
MNKRRFRSFIAPAPWLMAAGILLMPAAAQPQCSVAYSGLEGALGIVQSNTGNLLVTESGSPVPNTGRISIVDLGGNRRTLLNGLPSGINDVGGVSGPTGLFMRGRTLYVAISVGDVSLPGPLPGSDLPNPSPSSPLFSSVLVLRFSSNVENTTAGFTLTFADQQVLASGGKVTLSNGGDDEIAIELIANFPNYVPKPLPTLPANIAHSNPYGLVALADQLYVTDGGQNKLWQVDLPTGSFWTLTDFPNVTNPLYPAIGGPVEEAVPTGITYSSGQLMVALFRGIPFAPGTSAVEQVDPATGSHSEFIKGLKTAIAILPAKDLANTDYLVLQHASIGPFFGSPGVVLRFASPNSPGTVVTNCLTRPTSMVLDAKTDTLYVTEFSGRIVAIRVVP